MTAAGIMEWRPVAGFPGYEVSECGDLRRVETLARLRGYINTDGYLTYSIRDDAGVKRHVLAHRIVALAFIGGPPFSGMQVAHSNGSRINSHWRNLRWATPLENHEDRRLHGTGPVGERNPKAKITEQDVRVIRREYRKIKVPGSGRSVTELEEAYGLHRATIVDIAQGRTWTHVPMES